MTFISSMFISYLVTIYTLETLGLEKTALFLGTIFFIGYAISHYANRIIKKETNVKGQQELDKLLDDIEVVTNAIAVVDQKIDSPIYSHTRSHFVELRNKLVSKRLEVFMRRFGS